MESKQQPIFTTGKMEHIFKLEVRSALNKVGKGAKYLPEYTSEEAGEAMERFERIYMKIDGSCGALIRRKDANGNPTWELYNRFDDSRNRFNGIPPVGHIPLPEGGNSNRADGHRYYLRLLKRPAVREGGQSSALKGEDAFVAPLYARLDSLELSDLPDFNSVELVGKNFNNTPGVIGNGIALHSQQLMELPEGLDRKQTPEGWLKTLRAIMERNGEILMEGVVIEYRGKWWKIRAEHFCEGKRNYSAPKLL